jgi:hypothetical protein
MATAIRVEAVMAAATIEVAIMATVTAQAAAEVAAAMEAVTAAEEEVEAVARPESIFLQAILIASRVEVMSTRLRPCIEDIDGAGATTACWCPNPLLPNRLGLIAMWSAGTIVGLASTCQF